jgi:hypothetical protein
VASTVAAVTWASPARAACDGAHAASDVDSLPPAWRRALEALLEASAREGHPWSCSGALVALVLDGLTGPGQLTITPNDAPPLTRAVEDPDEVVPVGEALLARPLERPPPPPPAPILRTVDELPARVERPPAPPATVPVLSNEPRLLIDMLASARWSGSPATVWTGGVLRASLPFGPWSVGVWGRFEIAAAELDPVPSDFWMYSGSVGLSLGRRFVARPLELWAFVDASVAIVSIDGGPDGTPLGAQGARADPRVGLRLQGAVPFAPRWRAIFALDGEIGPVGLASERHRIISTLLPPIPDFTLGASIGAEIAQ